MDNFLTHKGYAATVNYSSDDDVFYGKVHGINDLISFEGASVKELKAAFKNAVDNYLSTCSKLGKEPNKAFKGSFNVRLTSELHQKAALIATKNGLL